MRFVFFSTGLPMVIALLPSSVSGIQRKPDKGAWAGILTADPSQQQALVAAVIVGAALTGGFLLSQPIITDLCDLEARELGLPEAVLSSAQAFIDTLDESFASYSDRTCCSITVATTLSVSGWPVRLL